MNHKPKQYTQGWVEFYKLIFKVNETVLIPRPETELLVDEVLAFIKDKQSLPLGKNNLTVLDLGTGSGNIAISLAKNSSHLKIIASEVSKEALNTAMKNAKLHGVKNNIQFINSNLLENIPDQPDIVVTNLPYIPTDRINYLDPSVRDSEPHVALNGGKDGFELYRKLFAQMRQKGWQPQLILGEIDYTHGELSIYEAQKYFPNYTVEVKTDLDHKQRILRITVLADRTK